MVSVHRMADRNADVSTVNLSVGGWDPTPHKKPARGMRSGYFQDKITDHNVPFRLRIQS